MHFQAPRTDMRGEGDNFPNQHKAREMHRPETRRGTRGRDLHLAFNTFAIISKRVYLALLVRRLNPEPISVWAWMCQVNRGRLLEGFLSFDVYGWWSLFYVVVCFDSFRFYLEFWWVKYFFIASYRLRIDSSIIWKNYSLAFCDGKPFVCVRYFACYLATLYGFMPTETSF